MVGSSSNILVLDDFRKPKAALGIEDVKEFLDIKRDEIRTFETETFELFRIKHKSKDTEFNRNRALKFEEILLGASDWIEDKISEVDGADKEAFEKIKKHCDNLIAKNERIKKNLTDDLATCRHVENRRALDPIKVGGFIVGTPLTLANLIKTFAPSRTDWMWQAGAVGLGIGTILAFHHQAAQMFSRAGKSIKNGPTQIKRLGKTTRNSFVAATFSMSVKARNGNEIIPLMRPQETPTPRIVYSAKM